MSFSGTQIVENPELLSAIEKINENKTNSLHIELPKPATQDVPLESPKHITNVLVPANKQLETRLPSGKRRITPMLLTSVPTTEAGSILMRYGNVLSVINKHSSKISKNVTLKIFCVCQI